jgi:oligopeptide transport system substrate-binding protein
MLASISGGCSKPSPALPSPSPVPRYGGTFRLALTEPKGLDPAQSEDAYQWLLMEQIFDGLVDVDANLNVRPELARTWTVSPDGLVYDFELRNDAHFHNGRPVTAEDVAYSLLRAARVPGGMAREYVVRIRGGREAAEKKARSIEGIEVVDAHRVIMRLDHAYAPFLATLAIPQFRVVPREEVEGREAAFSRHPVGSGPFKFVEWRQGDRLSLSANESYHGGRPYLERVEVHFGGWADTQLEHFLQGELDMAVLGRDDLKRIPPGTPTYQKLELSVMCLGLNLACTPLKDPRIRSAVALSLDRQAIVEASGRVAVPSRAVVPDGMPGGIPHGLSSERSVEQARRLLVDSGHPGGAGLPMIDLWANLTSPSVQATADTVARNLGEVGIKVRERTSAWSKFLEVLDSKQAPMYLVTWVADTPDRDTYLRLLFHTDGPNNLINYSDPQVDRLLDAATGEMDPEQRGRLYAAVEERVGAANVLIPLFSEANCVAIQSGLHGFAVDPFGQTDLRRVWWNAPRFDHSR